MKPQRLTAAAPSRRCCRAPTSSGRCLLPCGPRGAAPLRQPCDDRGEPVAPSAADLTLPRSRRCVPKIAFTVSERPEPSKPARPSTSPARTDSDTSTSWCRRVSPRRRAAPRRAPAGRAEAGEPSANLGDVPTEHRGDHLELGRLGDRAGPDPPAVAQDRDPVGDLEHLVEVVADEEQGDAGAAQASDHPEQLGHLARLERGRRLVEDHDPGVGRHARTMAIICWTPERRTS